MSVFERHPKLTSTAIALVVLIGVDIAGGTILRRLAHQSLVTHYEVERKHRVKSPRYHHDFAPFASPDSARWGPVEYPLRTNSFGFKDRTTREVGTDSSTRRVLFIGDSFTEGVGIEFDSTFVGRIATRARPHGVDVLNAGVSSYSPIIYWRKTVDIIERRGVPIDEVIVAIDLSDMGDEPNYYFDSDSAVQMRKTVGLTAPVLEAVDPGLPFHARARSWWRLHSLFVFRGVKWAVYTAFDPCKGPQAFDDVRCGQGWRGYDFLARAVAARGLPLGRQHMTQLATFLRGRGIPLTVIIYPWSGQVRDRDLSPSYTSAWKDWARREQVTLIDLFPPFFEAAERDGTASVTDAIVLDDDVHWNARGHAFVAGAFLADYCRQRLPSTVLRAAICAAPTVIPGEWSDSK